MNTLFLLLLFICGNTWAQTKHVLIDMDNYLLKEVPNQVASKLDKNNEAIKVGKTSYSLLPHTQDLISIISKETDVLLHFFTRNKRQFALSALAQIYKDNVFSDNVLNNTMNVLGEEDLINKKFDLKLITSDIGRILVITNTPELFLNLKPEQHLLISPRLFVFNSFEEIPHSMKNHEQVPKTIDEWENDRFNILRVLYAILKGEALAKYEDNFKLVLKTYKENPKEAIGIMKKVIANNRSVIDLEWKFNQDYSRTLGCYTTNLLTGNKIESLPLEHCEKKYGVKYIIANHDGYKCQKVTLTEAAIIESYDVEACEGKVEMFVYWANHKKSKCSLYDRALNELKAIAIDRCQGKNHVLVNPDSQSKEIIVSVEGIESLSLSEIFRRYGGKCYDALDKWGPLSPNFSFNDKIKYPESKFKRNDVTYPRHPYFLYRGIMESDKVINDLIAIKALLGDKTEGLYDYEVADIISLLKGELDWNSLVAGPYGEMKKSLIRNNSFIYDSINKALNHCGKNQKIPQGHAVLIARDIINKFFHNLGDINPWVNYRAKGFKKGRHFTLYSSVYLKTSSAYGSKVAIFSDKEKRSVDLTWYNQGIFQVPGAGFSYENYDAGEFVMPGWISDEDLEGYLFTEPVQGKFEKFDRRNVKRAYMRVFYNDKSYVLALDVPSNRCFLRNDADQQIYFCDDPGRPMLSNEPMPLLLREKVKVIGVFYSCNKNEDCRLSASFIKKYQASSLKLDEKLIKSIVDQGLITDLHKSNVDAEIKFTYLNNIDSRIIDQSETSLDWSPIIWTEYQFKN